jgi:putative restriction endonuclease
MDSGFDVLTDFSLWIEAASSHAPLQAWLALQSAGAVLIGLSMVDVARVVGAADPAAISSSVVQVAPPPGAPAAAAWFAAADVRAADSLLTRAWELSRTLPQALVSRYREQVALDLATVMGSDSTTEREAVVKQRIGQQMFRDGLMTLWQCRCAISGLDVPELLRAGHAKPWVASSDEERLDVYNGLLLSANLDAAFDAGLLCVEDDGSVLSSLQLSRQAVALLGLDTPRRVGIAAGHRPYLDWHRRKVFRA